MKYVALLRGITPQNPNMHNEKLRLVFLSLGFKGVQTVLSSGNVLFETDEASRKMLEEQIEKALFDKLGLKIVTIVRNRGQLKKFLVSHPFNAEEDAPTSRLNVTYLKKGGEIISRIDFTSTQAPAALAEIEKEYGNQNTTRTLRTVSKIVNRMDEN